MSPISWKKIILLLLTPIFKTGSLLDWRRFKKEKAIVVCYTGKLGDVVCLTPVLRAIKENNQAEKLILIGRGPFTDVLANNPYVDKIISFNSDRQLLSVGWLKRQFLTLKKFDLRYFFNLTNNFEASLLGLWLKTKQRILVTTAGDGWSQKILYPFYWRSNYNYDQEIKDFYFDILRNFNFKVGARKNQLFFNKPEPAAVGEFFQKYNPAGEKIIIGLAVGSGKDFKNWPLPYWAELINLLTSNYPALIVIFGTKREKERIDNLEQTVKTKLLVLNDLPLNILPYYLKKCQLFISVDTGPLYIADALAVPVVDILGPCDEKTQKPENNCRILTKREVCRPLSKILMNPKPEHGEEIKKCFAAITPAEVMAACQELIKN